jgi:hypothetical protein
MSDRQPVEPEAPPAVDERVTTTMTKDWLGRLLTNAVPGTDDATDFLGRAVRTGDRDYLGRDLVA